MPRHRVKTLFTDTDSAYFALAHEAKIDDLRAVGGIGSYVPEQLREAFLTELYAAPDADGSKVEHKLYCPFTSQWKRYMVRRTVCSDMERRCVLEKYSPVCKDCRQKKHLTECLHSERWSAADNRQRYTPGWMAPEFRGVAATCLTAKSL